jgi:hypothetical protein
MGAQDSSKNWVDRIRFETVTMVEMSKNTYLEEDRKFHPVGHRFGGRGPENVQKVYFNMCIQHT